MLTLVPIGIITVVLGFIIGVLGGFLVQRGTIDSTSQTVVVDEFSQELADEAGRRLGSAYTSVIDDLMSYMDDPDLQRADDQREAMVEYATLITPQFQDFAQSLQGKLDELIGSVETTVPIEESSTLVKIPAESTLTTNGILLSAAR